MPDCKSGVAKEDRKGRTGALPARPTSLRSDPASREESGRLPRRSPSGRRRADHLCSRSELRLGTPFIGPVAQLAERPVVCGRAEGANPFGSAIFPRGAVKESAASSPPYSRWRDSPAPSAWCSSNILGLGPRDRRCNSCRADHFQMLPWPNRRGIRLLSESMQVQFLPAAPLPGSVKVARRPVKPTGVGASPTLAANFQGSLSSITRAQRF